MNDGPEEALRRCEARLRQAEERLRLMEESVKDHAILYTDPAGRVTSWSKGAERVFGYAEPEILGRSAALLFTPEDREAGAPERELAEAAGTGHGEDVRWHLRKDGSRVFLSGVVTALRDHEGGLIGFAKVARDVTERELAEQGLRDGEERHRAILESISDAFFALDRGWRFTYVNRQAERLVSRAQADLLGKVFWEEFPGVEGTEFEGLHRRAMDEGVASSVEAFYPDHDRWYEVHAYPARDGLSIYFRDVTGRKRAEEELRAGGERVRLATESTGLGIWDFDPRSGLVVMSDFGKAAFGLSPGDELTYEKFLASVPPGDRERVRRANEGALAGAGGGRYDIEYQAVGLGDGVVRWIAAKGQAYFDRDGRSDRFLGTVLDITGRKRAEERIRREREWLRVTLASIGDAVIATDGEGRVAFINPIAEALTGWAQGEAAGRPLDEVFVIVNEATRRPVESPVDRVIREGAVIGLANHTVVIARDGHETPIEDSAAPIKDASGEVVGVVMVFQDATERRQVEAELRASEERRRLALDSAELGAWNIDPETNALATDERFRTIFHGSAAPIGFDQAFAAIHPDDRERVRAGVAAAMRPDDPAPYAEEYRVVQPDGTTRWVFAKGRANFEPGEAGRRLASLDGTVGDITDRKLAEAERQRLVSIVENSPDFIGASDALGNPLFLNRAGRALVGLDPGHDIRLTTIAEFFVPEQRDFVAEVVLPAILKDGRWSGELAFRHFGTGAAIPVLYDLFRVDDPRMGEPINFATVTRDITERKRAEEAMRAARDEAEAASRAKDQFLAVLSHELRTPLNPILLATSAMLERTPEPEEVRPTLDMILRNVKLQARLIDDLLDVMRIVQGKMPLHRGVCDCHALIGQSIEICRSEFLGKSQGLVLDLAAEHHHVDADSARLHQVLWNLVRNAVKFTPEGGRIAVRTRNQDAGERQVVIEVADTGIGIDPGFLPTIWDPFQQGETTITRRFGGLGLGLAICKGVVDAHGGTLAVESEGPGRGTTFRVVLKTTAGPAIGAEVAGDGEGRPPTPPLNRLNILLVEDEMATLRLMARLLGGLGHRVTAEGTVADAWGAFQAGDFDMIISDIGLPDGTGLDLMRRVRGVRHVPAIALTGYGMDEDVRRSREAGFATHMTKPIDFTKLEAMIRQVTN